MSEQKVVNGSCLCGAVTVKVAAISKNVGACHCDMCQKWTGGPLMALDCGTDVIFNDEASIGCFRSSEWAERGFCNKCGTHLFYRLTQNQQYIMPVGLFDDLPELEFDHQIFIEQKPDYYCFANDTKNMTGAEVFAQFAPPEE